MISPLQHAILQRFRTGFERLYGDRADLCVERLAMLAGRYGLGVPAPASPRPWTSRDAVLITYGHSIHGPDRPPLEVLRRFLRERVGETFTTLHILPFFPYSSDDGFSVIHFRQVNPELGDWSHIEALATDYRLMADLVLNHVSRQSGWFRDFEAGVAPGRDYFVTADPAQDLAQVVRPRTHPLLTPVATRDGKRHVWTTFSADQVDLNFANPDVLFEMLDLLLFYILRGARVIRLDAIAYLWKKPGTPCIHLPETHEVVKLFRAFVNTVAPDVTLLTETNVPHAENVSYFGHGDEAHMVYQFSLPPLLLHALHRGRADALTSWAESLQPPPAGCAFLNFTASHDGIGVRPLQGLAPDSEIAALARAVLDRGGHVSMKRNADGSESPYEFNITWFDAVGGVDLDQQVARHLLTQTVMLGLQGVPAMYLHSLTATRNDAAAVTLTGRARSINRHSWYEQELQSALSQPGHATARVFPELLRRLRIRGAQDAFDPGAPQVIHRLDDRVFAVERRGQSGPLLCLHNFSGDAITIALSEPFAAGCADLLAEDAARHVSPSIALAPYACRWLVAAAPSKPAS